MEESKPNILKRLYNWTISWAEKPQGLWALAILSFAESSFFPIPPDVLLIPLVFGAPKKWLKIVLICTAASVLGGVFGWYIGRVAWDALQSFFFDYVPGFTHQNFEFVQQSYQNNAFLAIFGAALRRYRTKFSQSPQAFATFRSARLFWLRYAAGAADFLLSA